MPCLGDIKKRFWFSTSRQSIWSKRIPVRTGTFLPNHFLTPTWPKNIFSISSERSHVNCQNNVQIPIVEKVLTYRTKFGQNYCMTLSKACLNCDHTVTKFEIWFCFFLAFGPKNESQQAPSRSPFFSLTIDVGTQNKSTQEIGLKGCWDPQWVHAVIQFFGQMSKKQTQISNLVPIWSQFCKSLLKIMP